MQIIGGNNILCIDKQLLGASITPRDIKTIYEQDDKHNPRVRAFFPWNQDVNHWLDISDPYKLLNEIHEYFTKFNPRGKPISPSAFDLH